MRFRQAALSFQPYSRTFAASLVVALLLATQTYGLADVAPKRVMMLHSFGPRFKPWSDYEQAIRSEINRQWRKPVDFLDHSLVNARRDDEDSEASFVEYLRTLIPADRLISLSPSARPPPTSSSAIVAAVSTTPMVFTAVSSAGPILKLMKTMRWAAVVDFPRRLRKYPARPASQKHAIVNGA
jgi:hypothetical protein